VPAPHPTFGRVLTAVSRRADLPRAGLDRLVVTPEPTCIFLGVAEGPTLVVIATARRAVQPKESAVTTQVPLIEALRSARDVAALAQALQDENKLVRKAAAEALGQIGDPRAVEALLASLRNDNWRRVREAAAEALGQIGDARAVEPLLAALRDADPSIKVAAAEALGQIGDEHAIAPLVLALQDGGWVVRKTAAAALGAIGDTRAIAPLVVVLLPSRPLGRSAMHVRSRRCLQCFEMTTQVSAQLPPRLSRGYASDRGRGNGPRPG
jgi:HEAT repeat protein